MKLNNIVIIITFIFQNIVVGDDILKKVEELEKEKKELYNQINAAIEDSVRTLRKTNDSKSITGLKYMEDLKKHLREFNKTDNDFNGSDIDTKSDLENRRKFIFTDVLNQNKKKNKHSRDPFDLDAVLRPKEASAAQWREILENRIKMQKRLDDWIVERQKEKERLKEYKLSKKRLLMSGKYEKCPRFGYSGSKKKYGFKKKNKKNTNKEDRDKKKKYPCCRKCCKKSYMGCL